MRTFVERFKEREFLKKNKNVDKKTKITKPGRCNVFVGRLIK